MVIISSYHKNEEWCAVVSAVSVRNKQQEEKVILLTSFPVSDPGKKMLEEKKIDLVETTKEKMLEEQIAILSDATDKTALLITDDVLCVQDLSELYEEAEEGLLVCPLKLSYDAEARKNFRTYLQKKGESEQDGSTLYGNEFLAGKREDLIAFLNIRKEILDGSEEEQHSYAVMRYRKTKPVYEGWAYIFRYLTTNDNYVVSTNTCSNPVCLWSLPMERETGMKKIYAYLENERTLPEKEKLLKMTGLPKAKRPMNPYEFEKRVERELKKRLKK